MDINLKKFFSKYLSGQQALRESIEKQSDSEAEDELNKLETSDKPTMRSSGYKAIK